MNTIRCSEIIWLDSEGRSNTYCVLERGHSGEHSSVITKERLEGEPIPIGLSHTKGPDYTIVFSQWTPNKRWRVKFFHYDKAPIIELEERNEEKETVTPMTKEQVLDKYGPYNKNDPRAIRGF